MCEKKHHTMIHRREQKTDNDIDIVGDHKTQTNVVNSKNNFNEAAVNKNYFNEAAVNTFR